MSFAAIRSLSLVAAMAVSLSLLLVGMPGGAAAAPPERAGDRIPGQFLVTLDDDVDAGSVAREYRGKGAEILHVYGTALNGFAGRMSEPAVRAARRDGRVVRVEQDGVVTLQSDTSGTQVGATWGLDRIDERSLLLDGSYSYDTTAANVTAYVIDTGILSDHADLAGRVLEGVSLAFKDGELDPSTEDCNGHGTHVAGTIGGATWGVAKAVELVPVRVFGCEGGTSWSAVAAAVDWVARHAARNDTLAVANMSLGGGGNTTVDDAVRNATAAGVVFSLSAGNSDRDACRQSPARVAEGLTVGATDETDSRAWFSNFGPCVDLFAPGVAIESAWHTSTEAKELLSGTSMSAPHVAGIAALYRAANPAAGPAEVHAAVVGNATAGVVKNPGRKSPNLLAHSLWPVEEGDGSSEEGPGEGDDGTDPEDDDPVDQEPVEDPAGSIGTVTTEVSYATSGGKNSDRHLHVTTTVTDGEAPVAGVALTVGIKAVDEGSTTFDDTATGTTGADGTFTVSISNAPAGCYRTTVVKLNDGTPEGGEDAHDDPGFRCDTAGP